MLRLQFDTEEHISGSADTTSVSSVQYLQIPTGLNMHRNLAH